MKIGNPDMLKKMNETEDNRFSYSKRREVATDTQQLIGTWRFLFVNFNGND